MKASGMSRSLVIWIFFLHGSVDLPDRQSLSGASQYSAPQDDGERMLWSPVGIWQTGQRVGAVRMRVVNLGCHASNNGVHKRGVQSRNPNLAMIVNACSVWTKHHEGSTSLSWMACTYQPSKIYASEPKVPSIFPGLNLVVGAHVQPKFTISLVGWAPPKFPLQPHKLAKLANALGVPIPIPPQPSPSSSGYSSSLSPHPDPLIRSPTPSTAYTHNIGYSQSISKYLLHIIPPECLLHDLEQSSNSPSIQPNAPGYHVQFRRGVLVPMHATLQSQLSAIAKEYALPSTLGITLYLVQSVSRRGIHYLKDTGDNDSNEPGPVLTQDIWRLLWGRVVEAEREERSRIPTSIGLKFGVHSSNFPRTFDGGESESPSVPSVERPQPRLYAVSPSSPVASSTSDTCSQTKSAPPSSSSISQSEPQTPDTSAALHTSPIEQFELPGLHTPSFIPILAKMEFDIDQRSATWYEPWLRSRRLNHSKRAESRSSRREDTMNETESSERKPPLDLILVNRMQADSHLPNLGTFIIRNGRQPAAEGYRPLSDSPQQMDSDHSDSERDDCESTTRLGKAVEDDPLNDVFGTDAETWANLHDAFNHRRATNPHIVDLTLDAAELSRTINDNLEDEFYTEISVQKEEDEVRDLLDAMSRPHPIAPSLPVAEDRHQPTQKNSTTTRKHVPPPLVLHSNSEAVVLDAESCSSPPAEHGENSMNMPYVVNDYGEYRENDTLFSIASEELDEQYTRFRRPFDEKRDAGVFDGLDLGLEEFADFDDDDPNDRRKSQYMMKAKLDEIEKTLAQFSPQRLKTDASVENLVKQRPFPSPPQSHHHGSQESLSAHSIPNSELISQRDGGSAGFRQPMVVAWPSVSFSSIMAETSKTRSFDNLDSSHLVVKGVSTAIPTFRSESPRPSSPGLQSESEMRRRELAEQEERCPPSLPPKSPRVISPTIPMSPGPFKRYPSSVGADDSRSFMPKPQQTVSSMRDLDSQSRPSIDTKSDAQQEATSSRFSADSITISGDVPGPKNRATLMNVKSLKNLWRKSNKSSISGHVISPPPPPLLAEPRLPEQMLSERLPPIAPVLVQPRVESALDRLYFNGESPYPVHRSSAPTRPTTPNVPHPPLPDKEEKERSIRKSILKAWKSPSVSLLHSSSPGLEAQSSIERPASRSKRPNTMSQVSGNLPLNFPDVPPSPHLPQHIVNSKSNGMIERLRSSKTKLAESPVDTSNPQLSPTPLLGGTGISPPRSHSVASSRASNDTKDSFDTSQFEMVSPQVIHNPSLTYPYHGLEYPR